MTQDEIIEMARQAGFMMENSAAIQAAEIFAKLVVAKEALAQPEQVIQDRHCSITLRLQGKPYPRTCKKCGLGPCIAQPTAQRTWVGLTDEDRSELVTLHHGWNEYGQAIEAKLKDKNCVG